MDYWNYKQTLSLTLTLIHNIKSNCCSIWFISLLDRMSSNFWQYFQCLWPCIESLWDFASADHSRRRHLWKKEKNIFKNCFFSNLLSSHWLTRHDKINYYFFYFAAPIMCKSNFYLGHPFWAFAMTG